MPRPRTPEACGMWGWSELTYADGLTLVLASGEWGEPYRRKQQRGIGLDDLGKEDQGETAALPDPEPLVRFPEAVKTRKRASAAADRADSGRQ